jgi:hypothetical protein
VSAPRCAPAARRLRSVGLGLGLGAAAVVGTALAALAAEALDPRRPAVMVVGVPRGFAPRERFGPSRHGMAPALLPERPTELWRQELPGGLEALPLVDSEGNVLAVLSNRMVAKLGPGGEERWRVSLGGADPALPPVLTSDGSVAVLCVDGRLRWVSPSGALRSSGELELRTRKAQAAPLALDDGSLIVAGEDQLLRVAADGSPLARAELGGLPIGGLIAWEGMTLATLQSGEVVAWRPPAQPRSLGQLGGIPHGGGVLVGDKTLAAVVEATSLVALDLRSGQTKLLSGGPSAQRQLEGPPTLSLASTLAVSSVVGELLEVDPHGVVVRRLALDSSLALDAADGGAAGISFFGRVDLQPSPPLVIDADGRIAFVRATGRLGLVEPGASGRVSAVAQRFCSRPLGVTSAGLRRMLVGCRNGSIGVFGDGGA